MAEAAVRVVRDSESSLQWLALALTPGLGPTKARRVLEFFGGIQGVFRASLTELEAAGIRAVSAQSLGTGRSMELAQDEIARAGAAGVTVVAFDDPAYPAELKQIYDPPLVLYVRGNVEVISQPGIAVVGTRHPTPYGTGMAERLACDLAARGLVIFSGMARGVDTAAHRGAISGKGKTVAVFGTGADVVYPKENARLLDQFLSLGGAAISEFPMATFPAPQNFPIRNRIISGLSCGILVVEGAQYSGSAITARLAIDQGREVFAVPGNITSKMSWGPNLLIKQGAKLVQDWNDVVVDLPPDVRRHLIESGKNRLLSQGLSDGSATSEGGQASLISSQGDVSRRVLEKLSPDASVHLDTLLEILEDFSPSELIAALFELEMTGLVKQLPGKNFVRVW